MQLTFLKSNIPLTKSFTKKADGSIEKSSYPNVWEVTSIAEDCPDLKTFESLLNAHAAKGHCLLKGVVTRPLNTESRKGSTDRNATTDWLCLDIDGIDPVVPAVPATLITPDTILADMGLGDVSYLLQWSGSQNIYNSSLRCHIFIMLTKPVSAPLVKQWLIQKNHEVAVLRDHQALTKTGNSLTWGLDITACQSDKLIYIAPPILKNIKNPLGRTHRVSVVTKKHAKFDVTLGSINSTTTNRALTDARVLALRDAAGLPKRKLTYKTSGPHEILVKPDECIATEIKQDRGFVYFNLNGGDSWAYYHPENNPDYIFNFKGEPVYLTKDLLPDYWASLQSAGHRVSSTGIAYLAFCDRLTGTYWKGSYDAANDVLDITQAKTLVILKDWAKENGLPLDIVPEWDMTFDPHDNVRVDFNNKTVNTFKLTEYMKAVAKKVQICPPTIFKIVNHALGSDVDITEHFMNWLAYIIQKRDRTLTAWVLHGTQGTGKGILMSRILRPIFGASQTTVRRMEEFKQPYNAYMKQCFLVFVDEVQTKALMDENGIMANIKNFITEPFITIRSMYAQAVECRNYTNWVFASNKPDPIQIDREDRRTNVGKYQPTKLNITDKELEKVEKELQMFHDYLLSYPVDEAAASTPLDTEDRDTLMSISETALDSVSNALMNGNMSFFIDQLPTSNKYNTNAVSASKVLDYKEVVLDILKRTDALTGKVNIARDELRTIYEYTVGKIPESPNKFTSLLKHHRIHIKKVWGGDKAVAGINCRFSDVSNFGEYLKAHFPAAKKAKT